MSRKSSKVKLPYIDARGNKPDFKGLFSKVIRAMEVESRLYGSDDYYDFWYGVDSVDEWEHAAKCVAKYQQGSVVGNRLPVRHGSMIPVPKKVVKGQGNKRGVRGSKKKTKKAKPVKRIWELDYVQEQFQDNIEDSITIYFYKDVNNSADVEVFINLHEFNDFLEEEGIYVEDRDISVLMTNDCVHCAIDPMLLRRAGEKILVCENSYGALCWECGATSIS